MASSPLVLVVATCGTGSYQTFKHDFSDVQIGGRREEKPKATLRLDCSAMSSLPQATWRRK